MRTATSRRSAWIAGVVAGVGAAALSLVIPFLGWTIAAAFVVGSLISGVVIASLGGFLAGGGATWLLLLLRADIDCRAFNGPGRECVGPDVTPWLAVGLGMLLAGAIFSVVAARR